MGLESDCESQSLCLCLLHCWPSDTWASSPLPTCSELENWILLSWSYTLVSALGVTGQRGKVDIMGRQALCDWSGPLWQTSGLPWDLALCPGWAASPLQPSASHLHYRHRLPCGTLDSVFIPSTYSKKFIESGNNLSLYLEMKIHLRMPPPTPKPCGSEFAFWILSSW